MSRYVDARFRADGAPTELVLGIGDVVRFAATGCRIVAGAAVEVIGILTESVLGIDGSILSPAGTPGTVLLRAREAGASTVEVFTGDPFGAAVRHEVAILVQP